MAGTVREAQSLAQLDAFAVIALHAKGKKPAVREQRGRRTRNSLCVCGVVQVTTFQASGGPR